MIKAKSVKYCNMCSQTVLFSSLSLSHDCGSPKLSQMFFSVMFANLDPILGGKLDLIRKPQTVPLFFLNLIFKTFFSHKVTRFFLKNVSLVFILKNKNIFSNLHFLCCCSSGWCCESTVKRFGSRSNPKGKFGSGSGSVTSD